MDQLVFEFEDVVPGYRVDHIGLPVYDDPGDCPVALAGTFAVRVILQPATVTEEPDTGYRLRVGGRATRVATEAVQLANFEGQVVWAVGVNELTQPRVIELQNPPRLVLYLPTVPGEQPLVPPSPSSRAGTGCVR